MSRTGRPAGISHRLVAAYLANNRATGAEISRATGLSDSAVYGVIVRLRRDQSPLLANLINGNARDIDDTPTVDILASALHSRTPLEQAWAA